MSLFFSCSFIICSLSKALTPTPYFSITIFNILFALILQYKFRMNFQQNFIPISFVTLFYSSFLYTYFLIYFIVYTLFSFASLIALCIQLNTTYSDIEYNIYNGSVWIQHFFIRINNTCVSVCACRSTDESICVKVIL